MRKKKDAFNDKKDQQETNNEQIVQETEPQMTEAEKMTDSENNLTDEIQTEQEDTETQSTPNKEEKYQQQINELQDKYVRLMAEFDNFRKRSLKERMELMKSAGEDVLINILPVIDDFERGLTAIEKSTDIESVKQGIQLIYNKFKDFLTQRGIKEIEALQQNFNVDVHEAVTKIPAPEEEFKGKVMDVIQKGYYLNDKVIRYAKVVVGE